MAAASRTDMEDSSPRPAHTLRRSRRQPLLPSSSFIRAMRSRFGLFGDRKAPVPVPSKSSTTTLRPRRPSHLSHIPSPAIPQNVPSHSAPASVNATKTPLHSSILTSADVRTMRQRSRPRLRHLVPIHALPSELLIHIFSFGIHLDSMFITTVSQVCGSWRELATQTPTLWRALTLDGRTNMWTQHIARACGSALDVSLARTPFASSQTRRSRRRTSPAEWGHSSVQWALHPALAHLPRWRSLSLQFERPSPFLWNAALSPMCLPGARASSLTQLELVYPANDDSKQFALFNGHAPRLRHAVLAGVRLVWDHGLFGNLVTLDYTHAPFTLGTAALLEVLGMLRVSCRLEELSLAYLPPRDDILAVTDDPFMYETLGPVGLPRLRLLKLTVLTQSLPDELLDIASYIVAPVLHTLYLRDKSRSSRAFTFDATSWQGLRAARHLVVEHGWASRRAVLDAVRNMSALEQIQVGPDSACLRVPVGEERHSRRWLSRAGVGWVK